MLFGLIEGDEREAHDSFIDRLLFDVAPRAAPHLTAQAVRDFGIRWPQEVDEGAKPFEIFGPRLAVALQLPASARPESVRAALTRDKGLIVVRAGVSAAASKESVAPIFKAWASFWESWEPIAAGRIVLALLLVKYATPSESQRERAERQNALVKKACDELNAQNFPGLTICRPRNPLGPVNWQHVIDWLSTCDEVRRWCASVGGTNRIERLLRNSFEDGDVAMEVAIDRLDAVLREFRKAS